MFAPGRYTRAMARDDATLLIDLIPQRMSVVLECTRCERRSVYNLAGLIRKHGNAKLTELAAKLAGCARANAANYHNRCHILWTSSGSG
jgi:hypothetical protein